jgi:hypothetical protein
MSLPMPFSEPGTEAQNCGDAAKEGGAEAEIRHFIPYLGRF